MIFVGVCLKQIGSPQCGEYDCQHLCDTTMLYLSWLAMTHYTLIKKLQLLQLGYQI